MLIKMPLLFLGHGNPMNAIAENAFTQKLSQLGKEIPTPRCILCISAHWLTKGTWVTHMSSPKTIHDFYGFPETLFGIKYPAPGSPETARLISSFIEEPKILLDDTRSGLDHGAWSILRHLYPQANIPVVQLSLNMSELAKYHFELGKKLQVLREKGILIIGSGNIVHNLQRIRWEEKAKPFDWAIEFDEWVKAMIEKRENERLVTYDTEHARSQLSVPTPDHYYPLLYILGAANQDDSLRFEYEGIENGSISMRSFSFGMTTQDG